MGSETFIDRLTRLTNRFWSRVDRRGPDECWPWLGPVTGSQDYGAFCFDSKYVYAHRFAYMLHHGETPEGRVVMHTCDDPNCVNPAHLSMATQKDNIRDSAAKGRWMSPRRRKWVARQPRERDGKFKAREQ